ncbi:MAG: S4 domain-containing protein YaaA [Erysipelotrichaceae bacterium]|nr:S4 domain-containing protein YaaA [Erysipelotrichaceae bacterium]
MKFQVKNDYITLSQLLKATDIIQSGGQAKEYLANAIVLVNAQQENRRGRKLYRGDVVEVEDLRIELE